MVGHADGNGAAIDHKGSISREKDSRSMFAVERFVFEKSKTRWRHSATRPKPSGMTVFFPRNDRPYGLEREAVQTENALSWGVARCQRDTI